MYHLFIRGKNTLLFYMFFLLLPIAPKREIPPLCFCPPPPLSLCLGYLTDPFLSQLKWLIPGNTTWSSMQHEFNVDLTRWAALVQGQTDVSTGSGGAKGLSALPWVSGDAQPHRGPREGCPTLNMCCLPQLCSRGTRRQVTTHLCSWEWS